MGVSLRKTTGRILALFWPVLFLLLIVSCDMSQLDSDTGFDSSKERELLSQAE